MSESPVHLATKARAETAEVIELGPNLRLQSENFTYRPLTANDATDRYIGWFNDPELQGILGMSARNWTKKQGAANIAKFNGVDSLNLGLFPKGEELPIGFCSIFLVRNHMAKFNLVIGEKNYRRKGVSAEFGRRIQKFIFDDLNFDKIFGLIDGRNNASIGLSVGLGMKVEGIYREQLKGDGGQRHDEYQVGMLKSDWIALKKELTE